MWPDVNPAIRTDGGGGHITSVSNCKIGVPILNLEVWLMPWGELHTANATAAIINRICFMCRDPTGNCSHPPTTINRGDHNGMQQRESPIVKTICLIKFHVFSRIIAIFHALSVAAGCSTPNKTCRHRAPHRGAILFLRRARPPSDKTYWHNSK
jgi:hypothetical protein